VSYNLHPVEQVEPADHPILVSSHAMRRTRPSPNCRRIAVRKRPPLHNYSIS
jgi:hypothetical protein